MATVFRKENPNGKNSPFWYASYKRADGTWTKKSTKQTDRKKAQNIADALERAEEEASRGTLTERRTRDLLNETLMRTGAREIEVVSSRQWLTDWLGGMETSAKKRTVAEYRTTINSFLEHLGGRADLSLEVIGHGDVIGWRDMLRDKKKLNRTTINNRVKILRMPFEVARVNHKIEVNPANKEMVKRIEMKEGEVEIVKGTFTPDQTKKLLAVAGGQWGGVIRLGFYTGARLRDLTNLRWNNIDLANGTMTLTPMKTDRKGKKITVPLHPELAAWLLSQPTSDDGKAYLFPALANRSSGGRQGLSYEFQKLMTAAGIAAEYDYLEAEGDGRKRIRLSFHSFRHAFSSMLANAGVSQEIRQKLTGHASAEVHALYTHLEMEVLRDATKKLPGLS